MKVLVCGSRDFKDQLIIRFDLTELMYKHNDLIVIEGGAAGADRIAQRWAKDMIGLVDYTKVDLVTVPADWDKHGKAAGYIRNQEMLDMKPDLVLAYVCKPLAESRGTNDMVTRAKKAGVKVKVTTYYTEEF